MLTIAKSGVRVARRAPKSSDDEELLVSRNLIDLMLAYVCFPRNIYLVANNTVMNHQAIIYLLLLQCIFCNFLTFHLFAFLIEGHT
jgi:hypothetical protein